MSAKMSGADSDTPPTSVWVVALALSLGAAVSLGITRFAYGLLLPPMRLDLGWSYTLAGAMNTANAVGYLVGALSTPWLMRRWGPGRLLVWGAVLAGVFMAASGFFVAAGPLLLQRLMAGVASAWVFVAGGLLAARLGALWPSRSGLLLGLYYGGTGWGIAASAVVVPVVLAAAIAQPHGWAWAWWCLAALCGVAATGLVWVLRALDRLAVQTAHVPAPLAGAPGATGSNAGERLPWRRFWPVLAGYTCFGIGYIGYMTFVIALLRDQGTPAGQVTVFYTLLGLAVVASSRVWAGLLDRYKDGRPQSRLNALLGLATVLPALTGAWPVVLVSGLLFGGVFLSVVASTTAFVRHNLPTHHWPLGISAFTTVFAAGQIVGPTVVGWIADGPGGLARGLVFSAVALWAGALLAAQQKALG